MRLKVWSGILIVGLLLTAGCGNQYHTEYGPSDNAMVANRVQSADQVQANANIQKQPAQMSPVSIPFLTIAGMSPGLVKPMEQAAPQAAVQPNVMPTMTAGQQPVQSPVLVAANNLETPPAQETVANSPAAPNMEGPVTMTKIDRNANQMGNARPSIGGNGLKNSLPLPRQQQLAYPAGGMFMYQAGQTAPINRTPQKFQPPQGNQVMTAQAASNPYIDAILKQAANYKRVYSVTSGQYFDPKTNQVFQTIQ